MSELVEGTMFGASTSSATLLNLKHRISKRSKFLEFSKALGIGAASFFREGGDEAEKDIAESPTAELKAEP